MHVVKRILGWGKRSVYPVDVLLSLLLALLLIGIGSSVSTEDPGLLHNFSGTVGMLWSVALIIPIATRRRWPQASALLFVALVLLHLLIGPSIVIADIFAPVLLYSAIVYGDPVRTRAFIILSFTMAFIAGTVMTWSIEVGALIDRRRAHGTTNRDECDVVYASGMNRGCARSLGTAWLVAFTLISITLLSCIVIAYWQRSRIRMVRLMQERNASIAAREDEERRIATLAERARIARDMHDMVAHTLSIIIVQSDGGRYAAAHDPALARGTMETIRRESEHALHNMGELLGVFDGTREVGYHDIDRLIFEARIASPTNTITRIIAGPSNPQALGEAGSTVMYRIIQESLTNIRKYAGDHVRVDVQETWDERALQLSIRDDGKGADSQQDGHSPGFGLIGMHERIGVVNGRVETGPCENGGFLVAATIPYVADAKRGTVPRNGQARRSQTRTVASRGVVSSRPTQSPRVITSGGVPPRRYAASGQGDEAPAPQRDVMRDAAHVAALANASGGSVQVPTPPSSLMATLTSSLASRAATLVRQYHSLPLHADGESQTSGNWVERMSLWTQRHYLAMDTASTFVLMAFFTFIDMRMGTTQLNFLFESDSGVKTIASLWVLVTLIPLAIRRRAPELSAVIIAGCSTLQLFFLGTISLKNILVLLSLYSVMMYGRSSARRWVIGAVVANCLLIVVSCVVGGMGRRSLAHVLFGLPSGATGTMSLPGAIATGVIIGFTTLLLCAGTMAWALWDRSRGSNALVQQQREDALRAEQDKQKVLAANLERNRIGAQIQDEVHATLSAVLEQTNAGLRMLDTYGSQGVTAPSDLIVDAFTHIGERGRAALVHMRRLLGVLRETSSTGTTGARSDALELHPVGDSPR